MAIKIGNTQNAHESKESLRAAMIPIASHRYCNRQYRGAITSSMICAGFRTGGIDSCQGDSGGPLTFDNNNETQLIGIVSFGMDCARRNFPGVYARVTYVRSWIRSVTSI